MTSVFLTISPPATMPGTRTRPDSRVNRVAGNAL
jgi:hypothetical protein